MPRHRLQRSRSTAVGIRPSVTASLTRIPRGDSRTLDITALVGRLPPDVLHELIRRRGLEASTDLIAAATPEQRQRVLDIELWTTASHNHDERFDAARMLEWLSVLVDADDSTAAGVVASLDASLVVAGLSPYIRVYDRAVMLCVETDGDERLTELQPRGDGACCDIGGYVVHAGRPGAWDAIVTLLVTLLAEHPGFFDAVMRGCRALSDRGHEHDGLDTLLAPADQHLLEVRMSREQRRVVQGHATQADARAFLQMARQRDVTATSPEASANPLAAAYFREMEQRDATRPAERGPTAAAAPPPLDHRELGALLVELGATPAQSAALLGEGTETPAYVARMRALVDHACGVDLDAGLARQRELAYLANVLVAGCSVQSRAFTPAEAMAATLAVCHLGLERQAGTEGRDSWLVDHDLIGVFEVGWATLSREVSTYTARHLLGVVAELRCTDALVAEGLHALSCALRVHLAADAPWRARQALDAIALLDLPAWAGLAGLLSECPVLPHAVGAVLQRRGGRVSATEFEFIASESQLADVRAFVGRLQELLV